MATMWRCLTTGRFVCQVTLWRRSFATPPPDMDDDHEFSIANDRRYAHVPRDQLPKAESLKTTIERVLPCVGPAPGARHHCAAPSSLTAPRAWATGTGTTRSCRASRAASA